MSLYLDIKYLCLISSRLRNYKQKKNNLWVASCCYCGDSKKKLLKARMYIYPSKDKSSLIVYCHNCNYSTSFFKLLEHCDQEQYKNYNMEKFNDKNKKPKKVYQKIQPQFDSNQYFPQKTQERFKITLPSIFNLPDEHYAKEYIINRKIPWDHWSDVYYADDFKLFVDDFIPNHGKELMPNDPRIVLLYTDIEGAITGVCGRSLKSNEQTKYLSVKIADAKKIYGLHLIDPTKRVYLVEGQIDSFMIPNCVAACDANLCGAANWLFDEFGWNPVCIPDRDTRNKQVMKNVEKVIEANWDVCLLPDNFPGKDLNKAHINGLTLSRIFAIINENIYSGLVAKLRFSKWRKCLEV